MTFNCVLCRYIQQSIGKASAKLESDRLHIAALNRDIESLAAAVTEQQFRSRIKTPETSGGPPGQPPRLGSITLEAAQKQVLSKFYTNPLYGTCTHKPVACGCCPPHDE